VVSARFPRTFSDFKLILHDIFHHDLGLSMADTEFFGERVWQIITSCQERRQHEYEKRGWWDFIHAEHRSDAYKNFFGYGITRSLVAAKADKASTKTVGDIFVQLLFDELEPGMSSDRVLNGPTNDVWINPWRKHLEENGVQYHTCAKVVEIQCDGQSITGARIEKGGETFSVTGDYYIAAFPVEVMGKMLQDNPTLIKADPHLANVVTLSDYVSWMNGAQFYLKNDVPITNGHAIYIDSPWALTSISQHQFWPHTDLSQYGKGTVKGILSVDISEWETPGIVHNKTAKECNREEIKEEVWAQLQRSLNINGQMVLRDEDLVDWNLDSDIVFEQENVPDPSADGGTLSAQTASRCVANREPLLVNLVNSWVLRPKAYTQIPNLFLASDYVQTYTDLATMEGANEAARRAVNAIIDASGSSATPCKIWDLHEPDIFAPFRAVDFLRYKLGLPWKMPFGFDEEPAADGSASAAASV
jgi:uncharacterized protein with NAD-binding domain and iron-sulfur cluster